MGLEPSQAPFSQSASTATGPSCALVLGCNQALASHSSIESSKSFDPESICDKSSNSNKEKKKDDAVQSRVSPGMSLPERKRYMHIHKEKNHLQCVVSCLHAKTHFVVHREMIPIRWRSRQNITPLPSTVNKVAVYQNAMTTWKKNLPWSQGSIPKEPRKSPPASQRY